MIQDLHQVLMLLILIHLCLCSYYYLLYRDGAKAREEDQLINELEKKLSDPETIKRVKFEKEKLPPICHGFHDQFFANNNQYLGWRHFWLKNQGKNKVESDNNFEGTPIRDYLNNMPNVVNEVTPKELQIR
jgi:hypothetical protein